MSRHSIAAVALLSLLAGASPASADVAGNWRQLEPEGTPPPGRMATATVLDAARDRVVVFGGYGHRHFYNDTWALELSPTLRWVRLPDAPFDGRHETTAILDPASERMLVFGGKDPWGFFGDLLALSLDTDPPAWSTVAQGDVVPGARETRAVLDPSRRRFVTALGFAPYYHLGDAWAFDLDGAGWTELSPAGPGPAPRRGQSAAVDGSRDRMLVFGGSDDISFWDEVWSLDLANPAWTLLEPIGPAPSPRYGQNLILDPARDRLVMFGGYGETAVADSAGHYYRAPRDFLNDAWVLELSGSTPRWERIKASGDGPSKRDFFAMVYDPKLERVLVIGGNGGLDAETNDVWELTFPKYLPPVTDSPPGSLRAELALVGARPVPGALEVSFRLPDAGPARLEAFDAAGRRVGSLEVGSLGSGDHTVSLARRDAGAPGLLWLRLARGSESRVKKVALHP